MSNLSRTITVAIALIASIGGASLSLAQDSQRPPGGMMGAGMMQRDEGQHTDDGRMMGGGRPGMGGSGMDECMMMHGDMGSGRMGGQMGRGMMMRPGVWNDAGQRRARHGHLVWIARQACHEFVG